MIAMNFSQPLNDNHEKKEIFYEKFRQIVIGNELGTSVVSNKNLSIFKHGQAK